MFVNIIVKCVIGSLFSVIVNIAQQFLLINQDFVNPATLLLLWHAFLPLPLSMYTSPNQAIHNFSYST